MTRSIVRKTTTSAGAGCDYILSDATPDRYGDIILSDGWELGNFKRNPVALFSHDSRFVIGKWKNIKVSDGALRGTLELAPAGTSPRINEIRKLVDAGILKAVSVGFTPIEFEERKDDDEFGRVYTKQELVECSLVAVPANPNALQVVKQLRISPDLQRLVFKTTSTSKEKRLAILANARAVLARGHHATTKRDAKAIHRAALALLDRLNMKDELVEARVRIARLHVKLREANRSSIAKEQEDLARFERRMKHRVEVNERLDRLEKRHAPYMSKFPIRPKR
jgi:HK97 family phage prohead protease